MVKVAGNNNIMEVHKKTADEKGCVWYGYEGNPSAKPYKKKHQLKNIYFIEHDKLYLPELLDIFIGPAHGGTELERKMLQYIPEKYQSYIEENWSNFAFSLKCKNVKLLKIISDFHKPIKDIHIKSNGFPYNPSKVGQTAVCYVI